MNALEGNVNGNFSATVSLSHAMGGELYDAGYTHGGTTAFTTYLRRLDPASGTVLWKQRLWTDEQDRVPEQVEK